MEAEEKELKSSIKCKIMASFFLLILMIGISVTWILQRVLQKTLIEKGLEEEAITDILSTFMVSGAGISMLAMLVAIGVAYILSRSIAEPIKKLTKVIEDISTGKLDTEIDPELKNSKDEIGRLANAFDRTIVSLKLAMKQTAPQLKKALEEKEKTERKLKAQLKFMEKTLDELYLKRSKKDEISEKDISDSLGIS